MSLTVAQNSWATSRMDAKFGTSHHLLGIVSEKSAELRIDSPDVDQVVRGWRVSFIPLKDFPCQYAVASF